ncbi:MAG TPA: metal-sensitive transcriptional regulator [Acidimicrobiia bacterium]|jgi:DNA-binding FrmR family transcriptional regulator|nr:metal-sensitive transcriptional regulator [Acidimicrobiia bacterium]
MKPTHRSATLNRLKTVRGHVEAVVAMVESDRYCPEVMKQISAIQSSLEKVNRLLLRNHLETCMVEGIGAGKTQEMVDELMETIKYTGAVTGPR